MEEAKLLLKPYPKSITKKKRVGRGLGSGKGRTSGKGHKGYKARAGNGKNLGFEGGQMPLIKRLPKVGFVSMSRNRKKTLNLDLISREFSDNETVDLNSLMKKKIISKMIRKVKLINNGKLTKKIKLGKGVRFSSSVSEMINQKAGAEG